MQTLINKLNHATPNQRWLIAQTIALNTKGVDWLQEQKTINNNDLYDLLENLIHIWTEWLRLSEEETDLVFESIDDINTHAIVEGAPTFILK